MYFLLLYDYVENAVERRAPFREAHRTCQARPRRPTPACSVSARWLAPPHARGSPELAELIDRRL